MTKKKNIGRPEREILVPVLHRNYFFKSPMYRAFPTSANHADQAVGPLSPLPCQAWHSYGISSAHHGEVRGCRRACERNPLRGRRRRAPGGRQNNVTTLLHKSPEMHCVKHKLVKNTLPFHHVKHDDTRVPPNCKRAEKQAVSRPPGWLDFSLKRVLWVEFVELSP
jgi:hypothetical protein